jgi:hypothetical protein
LFKRKKNSSTQWIKGYNYDLFFKKSIRRKKDKENEILQADMTGMAIVETN